jgi:hypothetical protein
MALRAGVVPRIGLQYIQVGRAPEIEALIRDIERIADGGASLRLIIGEYGAGKTFFLHLVRTIAQEKRLVTLHADLNPDRRLHATDGQARSLYAELLHSLATRAKPEGGALTSVVERFVGSTIEGAEQRGVAPDVVIRERLDALTELVGGYDFAAVIAAYWRGDTHGNETLKGDALRWLRGEFTTKTDARLALGVRTIVNDANVYDHLKLLARFVRLAGYGGLLVCLDEMVNLYKLPNAQARNANYEQILRILNDVMQGGAEGLGVLLGGTPEFLLDPRRGLFSYPALASRLQENTFAGGAAGLVDYNAPVMRLSRLTPEDLYILLGKLRHVFAGGDPEKYLVPEPAFLAFLTHCQRRIGDEYFRTPRTTIRAFVDFLSVLEQNPGTAWNSLVERVEVYRDDAAEGDALHSHLEDDDELTTLRL